MEENLRIEKSQIRTMKKDLAQAEKKSLENPNFLGRIEPLTVTPFQIQKPKTNLGDSFNTTNRGNSMPAFNTTTIASSIPKKPSPIVKDELSREEKDRISKIAREKFAQAKEKEKAERERLEKEK
ncbi:MAG: hypothetical protein PHR47_03790 [Candidatus Pacebacteria bacterium]|nr:hypothetical protein [Candidatus Paceibacterota bacterium]